MSRANIYFFIFATLLMTINSCEKGSFSYNDGKKAYQKGDYPNAIYYLSQVPKDYSKYTEALSLLKQSLIASGPMYLWKSKQYFVSAQFDLSIIYSDSVVPESKLYEEAQKLKSLSNQIKASIAIQAEFESKRSMYNAQFNNTTNEIQKNDIVQSACNLTKTFAERINWKIEGWLAEVNEIGMTFGKDYCSVDLVSKARGIPVHYKTWNNSFSEALSGNKTLIPIGAELAKSLTHLNKGDVVIFTCAPVKDNECKGGFKEASMTSSGGLREPEFIVKFLTVKRLSELIR